MDQTIRADTDKRYAEAAAKAIRALTKVSGTDLMSNLWVLVDQVLSKPSNPKASKSLMENRHDAVDTLHDVRVTLEVSVEDETQTNINRNAAMLSDIATLALLKSGESTILNELTAGLEENLDRFRKAEPSR
ncbi:hypothetical protein M231_05828 [Tremella mesenterica]|uniref:Uncharacterized protein n=1 Tax=Tremella mesenterica TaxID=5217 RepID=A0A4Q1BH61_TREME|nr:hypothetical protein M231_05828 [Tremella mesenterica]